MLNLPLGDIQGLILRSYGMETLRLLVLRVDRASDARRMLGRLPVCSGSVWDRKPDSCLNVAITFEGLHALELPPDSLKTFPDEFAAGAVARADVVGDNGDSSPTTWIPPFAGAGVHILLFLWAQTPEILEPRTASLRAQYAGVAEIYTQEGGMLPGGVAHFGYRDGFSQPTIEGGLPNPVPEMAPSAPAGEFLLGYPSQFDQFIYPMPTPGELGLNGSFVALRILAQDCAGFERMLSEAPKKYGIDGEMLAAKMCGRWRNGVPLTLSPETDSPAEPIPLEKLNLYDYVPTPEHPETVDDSRGYRCPAGSHMRRCNPRSASVAGGGGLKHRIVRRGLPYGPPYDPANPDDGIERGLLGIFIGVSLKDQFEFLMRDWVNGDLFAAGLSGSKDPVLGAAGPGEGKLTIPVAPGKKIVVSGFSRFVRARASAYGFLPSLTALQYIAGLE